MAGRRQRRLRCTRCGKLICEWHYVNNRPVCVDDRLCYYRRRCAFKGQPKTKVLERVKSRYGDDH